MAQGRSTQTIMMSAWIRTSRLSINKCLSARTHLARDAVQRHAAPDGLVVPRADLAPVEGHVVLPRELHPPPVRHERVAWRLHQRSIRLCEREASDSWQLASQTTNADLLGQTRQEPEISFERRGNNLTGLKDFRLKAKAGILP